MIIKGLTASMPYLADILRVKSLSSASLLLYRWSPGPMLSSSFAGTPSTWETYVVKHSARFERNFPLYIIPRCMDISST